MPEETEISKTDLENTEPQESSVAKSMNPPYVEDSVINICGVGVSKEVEAGAKVLFLMDSTGSTTKTYIVNVEPDTPNLPPPTVPAGWISQHLVHPQAHKYTLPVGGVTLVVIDDTGRSYIRLN